MNNPNQTTPSFFRFEDLRIYHKALDYALFIKEQLNGQESFDSSGITSSFNEAARQIALNIAEGSARNKAQFVHHLKLSKSAIRTCIVYATFALKEHMINEEAEQESRNQLMEMTKMLGALITSIQKNQTQNEENEDDSYSQRNW